MSGFIDAYPWREGEGEDGQGAMFAFLKDWARANGWPERDDGQALLDATTSIYAAMRDVEIYDTPWLAPDLAEKPHVRADLRSLVAMGDEECERTFSAAPDRIQRLLIERVKAGQGRINPYGASLLSADQIRAAAAEVLASGAYKNGAPKDHVDRLTLVAMRAYVELSGRKAGFSRPVRRGGYSGDPGGPMLRFLSALGERLRLPIAEENRVKRAMRAMRSPKPRA